MNRNLMKMEFRSACESVLQIITRNVSEMFSPGVQIGAPNSNKKIGKSCLGLSASSWHLRVSESKHFTWFVTAEVAN